MATFVPFNGKGLVHFNSVEDGYQCNFCVKSFKTFELYESHWPKCTGICKERAFRTFEAPPYPYFPRSFRKESTETKSITEKQPAKKAAGGNNQTPKSTSSDSQAPKETADNKGNSNAGGNNNSNNNKGNNKGNNKSKGKKK